MSRSMVLNSPPRMSSLRWKLSTMRLSMTYVAELDVVMSPRVMCLVSTSSFSGGVR